MASTKQDDIAGFAIDRAVIDNLLMNWFGGSYLDIIQWKEKAKKYDELPSFLSSDEYTQVVDKAKKYDELQGLRKSVS